MLIQYEVVLMCSLFFGIFNMSFEVCYYYFQFKNFDLFLMLDEFKGKVLGGFSDYLYRGFETVGLISLSDFK